MQRYAPSGKAPAEDIEKNENTFRHFSAVLRM